jgi:GNAT superfamily N-acetyltransferase
MKAADMAEVRPITATDVVQVAEFLHRHLNRRLPASVWAEAIVAPWSTSSENHGFMLVSEQEVVGAYLAFYSERLINGASERFCNLAAFCVLEEHRGQGLRLVRALLSQPKYHFTDLSPSGNVVELNKRLGFTSLDTATVLVPNLPWSPVRDIKLVSERKMIEETLVGTDLKVYRDHREAAAARHILITRGTEQCYVVVRRDRRKNLPLFASILYAGNPELLRQSIHHFCAHLLLRHRVPFTLAEIRLVGFTPRGIPLRHPRPKMFKSKTLGPGAIDYLYSELTCVAW